MQYYKLFIIGVLFVLTSCNSPKNFEFKGVKSVKLEKASLKKNVLNAQLSYFNPNHFEVTLKKLDCDILINDKKLTHYTLDTVFLIPSNANFELPARMEIELSNVLQHSVDIMFNKPLKISIIGNATLTKGIFTKTVPIQFTTVKSLNLKEAAVREALKAIQN